MTENEYNSAVNECKTNRCYYCGAKSACNAFEKIGFSVAENLKPYKQLKEAKRNYPETGYRSPTIIPANKF